VCIGLSLNGANLYGYVKCKVGHNKELSFSGLTNNFIREQVVQNVSVMERCSVSDLMKNYLFSQVVGMMTSSKSPPQTGNNQNII
jgi:hypothetical protein